MDKVTYKIVTAIGTTDGLTGVGDEQIIDAVSGEVIARFWNGNFVCAPAPLEAMEGPTLILEAA